jgi:sensor histidine kinase YesM
MDIQRYWYVLLITQAVGFYGKYQERQLLSSQLEAQLAFAQLEVLKIQLEPHFLFNTLNSIASLARHDGIAAENMTLQLADLLRMSLDGVGVHEVPLHQELMFLQKYVDIQLTRFPDRLSVETEIDPRTLDTLVPNLILQPLVENAIRHGISPRRAPGLVRITTWRDRDDVWMEIRDNGVGFTRGRGVAPSEGVGLRNTRSRLRQLYNEDHAMVLEDTPGGGGTVKIRVPKCRSEFCSVMMKPWPVGACAACCKKNPTWKSSPNAATASRPSHLSRTKNPISFSLISRCPKSMASASSKHCRRRANFH